MKSVILRAIDDIIRLQVSLQNNDLNGLALYSAIQNKKAKIEIFVRPNRACEFALVRRYLLGSRCLQRNEE